MTPADMEASLRSELRRSRLRGAAPFVRGLVALPLHPQPTDLPPQAD